MAKPVTDMSVAELQRILEMKTGQLGGLRTKREKLQAELEKIDEQIQQLSGGAEGSGATVRRRRRRIKNEKPLYEYVVGVLQKNKKGLTLSDLSAKVIESGYRTKSRNFNNVLYQCVFKSENIAHDRSTGTYALQS